LVWSDVPEGPCFDRDRLAIPLVEFGFCDESVARGFQLSNIDLKPIGISFELTIALRRVVRNEQVRHKRSHDGREK